MTENLLNVTSPRPVLWYPLCVESYKLVSSSYKVTSCFSWSRNQRFFLFSVSAPISEKVLGVDTDDNSVVVFDFALVSNYDFLAVYLSSYSQKCH